MSANQDKSSPWWGAIGGILLIVLGGEALIVAKSDSTHHFIRHGGYRTGHAIIEPWQTVGVGAMLIILGMLLLGAAVRRYLR